LASAVTGLSALYGYRLDENRKPGAVLNVDARLHSTMDYSALGYITGKALGTTVPYFKGLGKPGLEQKKALGAACATSGGIALWHGEGVTPESKKMEEHLVGLQKISVNRQMIRAEKEKLSAPLEDPIIALGCPHSTLKEIGEIADLVKGRVMVGRLWVFTSRGVYAESERAGYIKAIVDAGGRVYSDTCMVVAPLRQLGWKEVSTNSFKAGHYLAGMGIKTRMGTIRELLREVPK
jgi:predicted aconitase